MKLEFKKKHTELDYENSSSLQYIVWLCDCTHTVKNYGFGFPFFFLLSGHVRKGSVKGS